MKKKSMEYYGGDYFSYLTAHSNAKRVRLIRSFYIQTRIAWAYLETANNSGFSPVLETICPVKGIVHEIFLPNCRSHRSGHQVAVVTGSITNLEL